jgi:class 3 adenylate cyclase
VAGSAGALRSGAFTPCACRDQGAIDDAQTETRTSLTAFERLGATPDMQGARQLLDELDKAKRARAGKTRRVTRTFMFTDIVGSTNLLEAMGDEAQPGALARSGVEGAVLDTPRRGD